MDGKAFLLVPSTFLALFVDGTLLEGQSFQFEAGGLVQPQHQVHILHGLPGGAFQQVVNHGSDYQLGAMLFQADEAFVGVHHLFEVHRTGVQEGERSVLVRGFIGFLSSELERIG